MQVKEKYMISHMLNQVISENPSAFKGVSGCTVNECEALEAAIGVPPPRLYSDFLALMGRSAGIELVSDYDFSIENIIDHILCNGANDHELPIGIGNVSGSISLSLKPSKHRDDPFVYYSFEDSPIVHPELISAPSFSSFLARSLFCEGILRRQKYAMSMTPKVTPSYVRITSVVDIDREVDGLLYKLGARRFFGAKELPCYIASKGYVCYVRWPKRLTFAIHIGSENREFSQIVKDAVSQLLKLDFETSY